jgi:hypothetical protein
MEVALALQFQKATKRQAKLRLALVGPAGSGKTYTALSIAQHLGSRIAVLDTESGSASKYADIFAFDTVSPETFEPNLCTETIHGAESNGYDVLIIDSWSAFWAGTGGALEQIDIATKRSRSGNKFTDGWGEVTPMQTRMVDAILRSKIHIIATMRTKTEYVIEENERGKKIPRRIGLQPIQRNGMEYEFDVVADLDIDNNMVIGKTRCSALRGKVYQCAGKDVAGVLSAWLTDGAPMPEEKPAPKANGTPKPADIPTAEQTKTHGKLRMMFTVARDNAALDEAKEIMAEKWRAKLLTPALYKDLVDYGQACRANISTKQHQSEALPDDSSNDIPF